MIVMLTIATVGLLAYVAMLHWRLMAMADRIDYVEGAARAAYNEHADKLIIHATQHNKLVKEFEVVESRVRDLMRVRPAGPDAAV